MAAKENYKKVSNIIQSFEEKNKHVLQTLRKLEGTKKEKDAKALMETLEGQLTETMKTLSSVETDVKELQTEVQKKLGKAPPEQPQPAQAPRKPLSSDEQELTFELKAQLMKNVEMQNEKLKTEFALHEKMTESKMLSQQNKRLHEDVMMSRTNSLKLMQMFEKKAKEANLKLVEMKQELTKSQELAKKYQQLYELERRKFQKERGESATSPEPVELPPATKTPTPASYSFLGQTTRVNDVIRKNEVLVEENGDLKREIRRLKEDNANLIKKTKQAMADKDAILTRLETSESNRKTLLKRLEKEKMQYHQLSRSLTRQASDWILLKKQIAQFDEEYRWSQVIGMWLEKQYKSRGRFPPLAPGPLQQLVSSDPNIHDLTPVSEGE